MGDIQHLKGLFERATGQVFFRASLGNADGEVYAKPGDPSVFWVRQQQANGTLGPAFRAANEAVLKPDPGAPVYLVYNLENDLVIGGAIREESLAGGFVYADNNPADPQGQLWNGKTSWVEALSIPVSTAGVGGSDSTEVGVKAWMYIRDGTVALFPGGTVDLSGSVPSTGEWRLALVYLNSSNALALADSTPQTESLDPLDITDVQECLDNATNMIAPLACWRLVDGQTNVANEDLFLDIRQFINIDATIGYPVSLAHGGTGADLSATGPGVLVQAANGANVTVETAAISRGGTALTTITAGDILIAHDASSFDRLAIGLDGQALFATPGSSTQLEYLDHQRVCDGRLTLETGVAVSVTDQTAATSVYYTPYKGSQISLYDGSGSWQLHEFAERTLSLAGYTANLPYDIFIYDNSGTLTLESAAWASNTTRTTAIVLQDGIYVKTGATTRRYLGTIKMTATTGQCEDSKARVFVNNYYNRVPRYLARSETAVSWAYAGATWQAANNDTDNKVELVIGVQEELLELLLVASMSGSASTNYGFVGVGEDTSSNITTGNHHGGAGGNSGNDWFSFTVAYRNYPVIGGHYYTWMERTNGVSVTWYGVSGTGTPPIYNCGISGYIMG